MEALFERFKLGKFKVATTAFCEYLLDWTWTPLAWLTMTVRLHKGRGGTSPVKLYVSETP